MIKYTTYFCSHMSIAGKNVCLNSCKMSSVKHMLVTDLVDGLVIVLAVKSNM